MQKFSRLVAGKPDAVDYDERGRYGRIIGKVIVAPAEACLAARDDCPKTLDTNLAQFTVGLAWWYRKRAKDQRQDHRYRCESAETLVREENAVLWAENEPVPSWEWRREKRK